MPGARRTRSLVCEVVVKNAHEYSQRSHRKSPGIPARNGFTAYVELSPVTGLFCHRRQRIMFLSKPGWADSNSANLTPASGRQDHTILPSAKASLVSVLLIAHGFKNPPCDPIARKTLPRPPHPHPASVTIAIRPSGGVGCEKF